MSVVELGDRVAVVTGGASGIGAAVVERLAGHGARTVIWDRGDPADVRCDVSDPASVDAALDRTLELAGPPTLVVACAGIGHSGLLCELDPSEWDRVMDVNLKGVWLTLRACARSMKATGGAMGVITSVNSRLADANMGAYCVSKAGAEMLVRVAANEWAEDGIRVNGVGPGVTNTPMLGRAPQLGVFDAVVGRTPLGRLGEAAEIADAVIAMLSLDWVTGQNLMTDGGLSNYSPIDMRSPARRNRA